MTITEITPDAPLLSYDFGQKVKFKHCDPAGIVFYPRFFEMINDAVEAMFEEALGWPFETLLKDGGVPTASVQVDFLAPCRHGDRLVLTLAIARLGGKSMMLDVDARCGAEPRFRGQLTLVHVDGGGRLRGWPDHVRRTIEEGEAS